MLTARPPRRRAGATLAELLVAITLAAIVLGTASASVLRQQRGARHVSGLVEGAAQARAASLLIPAELADLTPSAGDLVGGEVRDTAVQLRAAIATGITCDSAIGRAVLALNDGDDLAPGGMASPPRAGDSLWWYTEATAGWRSRRITDVRGAAAPCAAGVGVEGQGSGLLLALAGRDTIRAGALVRVTRPLIYLVYRGGDGSWQLGLREWSDAAQRFAPPQPIAGPFARRLSTGVRTGFRYFDADDWELAPEAARADVGRIARIRITTVAPARSAGGEEGSHADSVDVALQRPRGL